MEQKKKKPVQKKKQKEIKLEDLSRPIPNPTPNPPTPFPKKLYVYKEEDGDEVFYIAQSRAEDCMASDESSKLVAVYEITGLSLLKVTIEENFVKP